MSYRAPLLIAFLILQTSLINAQTLIKEARNSFVLFTQLKDFSKLEQAKKQVDGIYISRRDSFNYRNNLLRSMIYSALAYTDQGRKLSYVKDPAEEALLSLGRLTAPKLNDEHQPEISFCKMQLASAYLAKANAECNNFNYSGALGAYKWVDSLSSGDIMVKHNIAVLCQRLGDINQAVYYYEKLVADKEHAMPEYFLALSNLYDLKGDVNRSLDILKKGRVQFRGNKDILFKEINIYADNGTYAPVMELIDDAINMEPENQNLYYLAGFSYDLNGNRALAEKYYRKLVEIEPYNYDGNYALGLLYLNLYLKNNREEALNNAKKYLVKAGEIDPNAVNVLKSLAILYKNTGDTVQLKRVNNKLNQIILN